MTKKLAIDYNNRAPPKRVDMLDAYLITLEDDGSTYWVEAFVKGTNATIYYGDNKSALLTW